MTTLTRKKEGCKKKTPEIERFRLFVEAIGSDNRVVAASIGVSYRTLTRFLWENKPLSAQVLRGVHSVYGVSIDWLVSGAGEMFVADVSGTAEPRAEYVVNGREQLIVAFVREFLGSASADQQAWLEVQLLMQVPPFRDFVEKVKGVCDE